MLRVEERGRLVISAAPSIRERTSTPKQAQPFDWQGPIRYAGLKAFTV
jgi:hypothetical protein